MDRCQVCGRYPAKKMAFRAHQGFVIFRRVAEISGIFCRDHAIEAYLAARAATLKGMWFNPGSLLFGSIRSLYDSLKLLDLPEEVKDEPWVLHVVACPACQRKVLAPAGPVECDDCGQTFAVVSCGFCSTVHVVRATSGFESLVVVCRSCGRRTEGPSAVRNWSCLLLGQAIAEVCASIASADRNVEEIERSTFREAVKELFHFQDSTVRYLEEHFDRCVQEQSFDILSTFSTHCEEEFIRLFLGVAVSVAEADGQIDDEESERLRCVARCLGIDPDSAFDGTWNQYRETFNAQAWWVVLGVSKDASLEEVLFAYRRLAMQFHPDVWARGSRSETAAAEERMRVINAALEQAKRAIETREADKPPPRPATPGGHATAKATQAQAAPSARPRAAPKPAPSTDLAPTQPSAAAARAPGQQTTKAGSGFGWSIVILLVVGVGVVGAILGRVPQDQPALQGGGASRETARAPSVSPDGGDSASPLRENQSAQARSFADSEGRYPLERQPQAEMERSGERPGDSPQHEHSHTLPPVEVTPPPKAPVVEPTPYAGVPQHEGHQRQVFKPVVPGEGVSLDQEELFRSNMRYYEKGAAAKRRQDNQEDSETSEPSRLERGTPKQEIAKPSNFSLERAMGALGLPRTAEGYVEFGHKCCGWASWDFAIAACNKAIELNPKLPEAYHWRAYAYRYKGDYDAAIRDCNTAIQLRPSYVEAYRNRKRAYEWSGREPPR